MRLKDVWRLGQNRCWGVILVEMESIKEDYSAPFISSLLRVINDEKSGFPLDTRS